MIPSSPSFRWPDGKRFACSFSWDDGRVADRRVVEIHDRYGIKGTFHLNSGSLDTEGTVTRAELPELFAAHEVSLHSVHHPFPTRIPASAWLRDVLENKEDLEAVMNAPVRSASWPFGDFDGESIQALRLCGVECCRSTVSHGTLRIPSEEEWLRFPTTCHFSTKTAELWRSLTAKPGRTGWFSVWSHSFEIEDRNEWDALEALCAALGDDGEVWPATVIEVFDYVTAWRRLRWSVDHTRVWNPSALTVWAEVGGTCAGLAPGLSFPSR